MAGSIEKKPSSFPAIKKKKYYITLNFFRDVGRSENLGGGGRGGVGELPLVPLLCLQTCKTTGRSENWREREQILSLLSEKIMFLFLLKSWG